MKSVSRTIRPALIASLAVLCAPAAHATLLVYEGFDYTVGSRLNTHAPNNSTVGLNKQVTYYDGPSDRTANYTVTTGLTFAGLQTSGGALQFTTSTNVIGANLSLSSAHTGTLWSSYLVHFTQQGSGSGNGAVIRVGDSPSNNVSARLSSWADSRASTNSQKFAVGYASDDKHTESANSLALGTTYIVINRFTHVGQTLSSDSPGVATSWALTEAQYGVFITQDNPEAWLDDLQDLSRFTAKATHSVTSSSYAFNNSSAIGIVTVGDAGIYDELRYGSTLASVTPVPEPATAAVLAGLLATAAACAIRRPRKDRLTPGR